MPIERDEKSGSISITGKDGMHVYRMLTLKMGLSAELRGMKLTRGVNCFKIVKQEFGLKGTKAQIYAQFCVMIADMTRAGSHLVALPKDESK